MRSLGLGPRRTGTGRPRGARAIEKRSKAQLERPRCSDGAVQGRDTAGRLPGFQGHRRGDGTQEAVLTEGAHAALSRRDERCRSQGVLGDGGSAGAGRSEGRVGDELRVAPTR